ncbi:MAG: hypothetical protein WCV99_19940 [Sterolibacterium sp.]|jgi:hypothetical protein
MNALQSTEPPDQLLQEWQQLNYMINEKEHYLAQLNRRRSEIQATLDTITKPASKGPVTQRKPRGYEYNGVFYPRPLASYISITKEIFAMLFREFPQQIDQVASAVGQVGRTRCYLSRAREDLFPGKDRLWIEKHSAPLTEEWWIDTNLSRSAMRRVLSAATRALGIRLGDDLKISWMQRRNG